MQEPLCGRSWYLRHRFDYTQHGIASLTITIIKDGSKLTVPNRKELKGVVKDMVKSDIEVGRCQK